MKNSHFSLRASIKSETTIDLCMKKWGSNNIDWPHTRESGGSFDPPPDPVLPRSMVCTKTGEQPTGHSGLTSKAEEEGFKVSYFCGVGRRQPDHW